MTALDGGIWAVYPPHRRVITTELLAQAYETDTNNIKNNFNNHKDNFKEGVHYYLLKGDDLRAFKREVNDIDLVAPNVNQLYLWTERGANRHCKILDTPKAWEQFDNLEETYFLVKEQRKAFQPKTAKTESQLAAETKRANAMALNAKNRTAERFQKLWDRANVKPEYQALALESLFAEEGVSTEWTPLYSPFSSDSGGGAAGVVSVPSGAGGGGCS